MKKILIISLASLMVFSVSLVARAAGTGPSDGGGDQGNGSGKEKEAVCHIPPGNPDNAHTISVSANAVDAHLGHGDYLGECAQ